MPKNKKIKRADQILPEVYGTTLNENPTVFRKTYTMLDNMCAIYMTALSY
jgi:hypothetical protein